jgi:hypothetical protein
MTVITVIMTVIIHIPFNPKKVKVLSINCHPTSYKIGTWPFPWIKYRGVALNSHPSDAGAVHA